MKTIGLLGGMSWESTVSYYQQINRGVKHQLGGLHSAKIVLNSVDFAQIEAMQHRGDWSATAQILSQQAQLIQAGGADCLLICTNTMHKVADQIARAVDIPLLHIADATGQQLVADKVTKVGLLGTGFTMEQDFYKQRLTDQFAIEVEIPDSATRAKVHHIIYTELCKGEINADSREVYLAAIDQLVAAGAQAVILGCTEIALLVKQSDTLTPLYDTTALHADAAVSFALTD